MSILHEIFAHKRQEVARARARRSEAALAAQAASLPVAPDFIAALKDPTRPAPRLIAEIKRRSPSRGLLRPRLDPLALARTYARHGAAAISVLTDERYFGGSLDILAQVAALELGRPLLRKDFIFDPYQLLEARVAGASAVLLILAMLSPSQWQELLAAARELHLAALVECHTEEEVFQAVEGGARLIGVNNRNLHTFEVDLNVCLRLRARVPSHVVYVAESGIHTPQDVAQLARAGVDAMLIGEALVTAPDPASKLQQFLGPRAPTPQGV